MQHVHSDACRHQAPKPRVYRLPRTVVPKRYDLTIESDPDRPDFNGSVTIELDILKPVSEIKLNALDLVLDNIMLSRADGTCFTATASFDKKTEIATLALSGIAGSGKWKLAIDFKGQVRDDNAGLFCATKEGAEGVTHKILCTQFEVAEARRVFPCFDEPDFKATFKVNLILDRYHMALSNGTGICSRPLEGNRKLVEFEETVLMSSYLVCFTLGPIVSSDPVVVKGKELRVWSLPGNEDKTQFALEVAAFGLDYFERYFDISYPNGNKIDMVAIPGFAWGGMENVGLIICGANILLTKNDDSPRTKQSNARIILHELAHQWFGDYVTMRWWNGLWLNESFATFMASKACQAWSSEINEWREFCRGREKAYRDDCVKHTHPIEQPVENARHAIHLVDAISYEKGCSVLYQFEQFIGEEMFRQGISHYLKKHAFGNTESSDLWDSLEAVCHAEALTLPLRSVLDTWISQSGHPEILVSRGKKDGHIQIEQSPFRLLDTGRKTRKLWPIPLIYAYAKDGQITEGKLLLNKKRTTISLPAGFNWVKLNAGGSGFYRVRYTKELLKALTADIDNTLDETEKSNLLADAGAFVDAAMMSAADYFELLQGMTKNSAIPEFEAFNRSFQALYQLLDPVGRKRFRKLLAETLRQFVSKNEQLQKIITTPDGQAQDVLPFVASWRQYNLNLSPTIQQASKAVLKAWKADPSSVDQIDTAAAAMILNFGRVSMPEEFAAKQKDFHKATALILQNYVLRLVALRTRSGSAKALDVYDLFAAGMLDYCLRDGGNAAERVLKNWRIWLDDGNVREVKFRLDQLAAVDDGEEESKLLALFKEHPFPALKNEIAKAMELVRANVIAREKQSPALAQYLLQYSKQRNLVKQASRAA